MSHQRFSFKVMITLGALLLTTIAVPAQVTTATVYGIVTDASGAQLPGATVTITNEQTGATQSAKTNDQGEFTFNFLQEGRYTLSITAGGFKEQAQPGIELAGGQRVRLSYELQVGAVTEKVTVTAEAPVINAVNAEQSISHDTTEVRELPLARRDWTNLVNVGNGLDVRASGGGTGVAINGLPPGGLSLTVDGTQGSGSPEDTSLTPFGNFNLIKIVSLEAISEVNVNKGIIPAEYANTLSGNVGLITKSGTNEYHGTLFENYNGRVLNARNQFLTTKPNEVFNQFGGSIGGPAIKNKLFFFGAYEGYRQRRVNIFNQNVPTAEFRARAIAAVPAYKPFFDTLPLPTESYPAGAQTGVFIGGTPFPANNDHFVVRGDYNINDTNRLSSRYTRGRPDSSSPQVFIDNPVAFIGLDDSFSTSYFRTGQTYSSETRFGYNRNDVTRLIAGVFVENGIGGISGLNFPAGGGELLATRGKGWSIEEIIAFNRGRHSIKFGGIFQYQNQTRENVETPFFTYNNEAEFLANDPSRIQVTFGLSPYLIKQWTNGYFIQDDFKLRPNLVVNLGLRWDYFSAPTEEDDRLFNRDEPFGLGPLRTPEEGIFNSDKNNFAPRVGFAWTVDKGARTVVRSGFGMYYTRLPIRNIVELVRDSLAAPFRVTFSRAEAQALGLKYPVTNAGLLPIVSNPNAPWTGTTINPDFPSPYSMQWVLSLQRQLTQTIAVETSYVGTRGIHLLFNRQINTVDRVTGLRPYAPAFGEFRHFDPSDSTSYHAWQTSVQKRFSSDFLVNAYYTWSRSISYSAGDLSTLNAPQDPNNIRLERGPSPFDVSHRFTADFLYELPFAKLWGSESLWKRLLFAGWQGSGIFRAETGSPLPANITTPSSIIGQRVDFVGGSAYLDIPGDPVAYLNRAAFAPVPVIQASGASARPGTLGRNAIRLPGFWNLDLTLAKNLVFTERVRMQLRADMFNAFNHTNFSTVNTTITSGNFGRFTATRGARVIQLNMRLSF